MEGKLLSDVLGFSEKQISETLNNKKTIAKIEQVLLEGIKHGEIGKGSTKAKLLYKVATNLPKSTQPGRLEALVTYIMSNHIATDAQLIGAFEYFKTEQQNSSLCIDTFELATGIGINVTEAQITEAVDNYFEKDKQQIISHRYKYNFTRMIIDLVNELKWADRKSIVNLVEQRKVAWLGGKTAKDMEKIQHDELRGTPRNKNCIKEEDGNLFKAVIAKLHKVGENYTMEGYVVTPHTMELLQEHVKACKGKYRTRFPPEPNGILHIGHAKAMNFNFNLAKAHNGHCILRYDDTNPAAEEERFFNEIFEMVTWLGHKPWKITHSSDYFHQLYEYAVELVRRGLAYVDHQSAEEISIERGGKNSGARRESPYRNRLISENLTLLEEMRQGLWDEGKACLRMKQNMNDGNPQMWDLIAYRVKFVSHPKTGSEWCIYPSYDFAHCLVDSIENITHSLCTVEFQQSRVSYYWLCNALDVYCPVQWEYSRLEIANTVLSKRKILKLLESGVVHDWDDPRLHTLPGLKRRGFPPQAINNFCDKVGIKTSMGTIDNALLEACVRSYLNEHALRTMVVIDPLKVTLIDYEQSNITVEVADLPNAPTSSNHLINFTGVFYIERNDFCECDEKSYKRLTVNQSVGLAHIGYIITVKEVVRDTMGNIMELKALHTPREKASIKAKAYIHWVSEPAEAQVRWYSRLLTKKEDASGNVHENIDPNSLIVFEKVFIDQYLLAETTIGKTFQFGNAVSSSFYKEENAQTVGKLERVGYFCVDPDSFEDHLVFNLTVTLREDKGKDLLTNC